MRKILLTCLVMAASGCAAGGGHPPMRGGPPPRHPGGPGGHEGSGGGEHARLFISPMGEPFRDPQDPSGAWFRGADVNHDGKLTLGEFTQDAARFFAVLDRGHDGEIDPEDIDYYETELAPEIRGGGGEGGGGRGGGRPHGGGGRHGGGGPPGGGGGMGGGGMGGGPGGGMGDGPSEGGQAEARAPAEQRRGAARYGYLDFPEPVTSADANLNRGVSPAEFAQAAEKRFAALDGNHDGMLDQRELPKLSGAGWGGPPHGPRGRPPAPGGADDADREARSASYGAD